MYDDFVRRVAEGRGMTVEAVEEVARGRVWTGADAHARGLVDTLGGLRTAVRRAKVLAGLDEDDRVKVVSAPGSSLREMLRPRPSSQPAASLPDLAAALVVRGLAGAVDSVQQQMADVNAVWLGSARF